MPHLPANDADERSSLVRTAAALVALIAVLFGGAFLYAYRQSAPPPTQALVISPPPEEAQGVAAPATTPGGASSEIMVHVVGAVKSPGVVRLAAGQRVIDAINAAGGLLPDADAAGVNMAAHAVDGDQIVVPRVEDSRTDSSVSAPVSGAAPQSGRSAGSGKLVSPGDGTVNINTADATELQRLPGIGPAMAARILAHRKEIGRFTAVEQLLDVSGIGEKRLAQMKPFVRIR